MSIIQKIDIWRPGAQNCSVGAMSSGAGKKKEPAKGKELTKELTLKVVQNLRGKKNEFIVRRAAPPPTDLGPASPASPPRETPFFCRVAIPRLLPPRRSSSVLCPWEWGGAVALRTTITVPVTQPGALPSTLTGSPADPRVAEYDAGCRAP